MAGPKLLEYYTRILPALSVLFIVTMLVYSFLIEPYGRGSSRRQHGAATPWQLVLSVYTVLLHIVSVVFPARVVCALGDVMRNMKKSLEVEDDCKEVKTQAIETDKGTATFPTPLFVVILPAYKEEMSTLEETLRVLASHPQACHCYHVYLAMEQKEEKSEVKAKTLIELFGKSFYKMSYTIHPEGIPGEAQGKSSNESWAAKQASRDYPEEVVKRNVIVTVMDADTHLSRRYFAQIARKHLKCPETNDSVMYVPPIVFDRNLQHVPLPVRTADLMWAGAGLSSLYEGSTVCIPTSVYSLPMTLVEHVGGWDTGPGAIGEDLHMFLKCFFALSGNLNVQVIYAAASQCNVSSDVRGLVGYIDGLNARYRQALRHMWGSLDSGFTVREACKMVGRHGRARRARIDLPLSAPNSNWTAFYTSSGLHKSLTPNLKVAADDTTEPAPPQSIHKLNCLILFQRMFEAHFVPIHLAVILTTSSVFSFFTPGSTMPEVLHIALDFASWCRLAGWSLMLCFFWRFEKYHQLCTALRQEEMREAGLLDDMLAHDGFSPRVFQVAGLLEAALFPIGGFIFGAIPALQAVLSHVFTERLTYVVSLKPQVALKQWAKGIATPGWLMYNFFDLKFSAVVVIDRGSGSDEEAGTRFYDEVRACDGFFSDGPAGKAED